MRTVQRACPAWTIWFAISLLACGSSGSGGSSGTGGSGGASGGSGGTAGAISAAGANGWAQRCQGVVDHNASCGKGKSDAAAATSCVATAACVPSVWSASVVDTSMTCLSTLACLSPDDDCISATASVLSPTVQALFTACQDKASQCAGFGCLETTFLVSDSLATRLQACLSQACDAASTCLETEYFAAINDAGCTGELPFGG